MGSQRRLPRLSVCEPCKLTARSRRSVSATWIPLSRGSICLFVPTFPGQHASCLTRSMTLFFLCFLLPLSLCPDDGSKRCPSYYTACLLQSRCASRGKHTSKAR